jgi:hypothetical protein
MAYYFTQELRGNADNDNTLHGHSLIILCPCKNEAGFSSLAYYTYNWNIINGVVYSTNVLVVKNNIHPLKVNITNPAIYTSVV